MGFYFVHGNDAAVALAEYVGSSIDGFANMMNSKANELGLTNTAFKTPHGLDKEGHYTTAYELALLSDYALHNETFKKIVGTKTATITINGVSRNISNTNELLGNFNGVYGIKTGFTNGANRCLVSACKRDNLDLICVVLGADTKKFRTSDSIKLLEYCFTNFSLVNISDIANTNFEEWRKNNENTFSIYKSSPKTPSVKLKLSNQLNVPYVYSADNIEHKIIPIKNSEIDKIHCNINCDTNLIAPISKNSKLGILELYSENKLIYSNEIVCENEIAKKNFFEFFVEILKKIN